MKFTITMTGNVKDKDEYELGELLAELSRAFADNLHTLDPEVTVDHPIAIQFFNDDE